MGQAVKYESFCGQKLALWIGMMLLLNCLIQEELYWIEDRLKAQMPSSSDSDVEYEAYQQALEQVWEELAEIPDAKRRFNAAEHLVHTTKKNPARFDFDLRFPKMPSYLRRAAIQHALGSVSSYETRMDLWEKSGEKAGKPRLAYENHAMPVFYRDVMYREEKEGKDEAYLKLYDGHDWKWFCVRLNHTDIANFSLFSYSNT